MAAPAGARPIAADREAALVTALRGIVGRRHVLTGERTTRRYRQGYRHGGGGAIAVVRPGSLVELWRVALACVAADASIIMQAANTALTGGSTPDGEDYPGGVMLVSTEYSLFGLVTAAGELELINHLGIALGDDPQIMLARLEEGDFSEVSVGTAGRRASAASDYAAHVRDVEAASPARFNADPRHLHEAAGSAGKLIVFAVRLDTFPREAETTTFYIGTNDPEELTELRRTILGSFRTLPISGNISTAPPSTSPRNTARTRWLRSSASERIGCLRCSPPRPGSTVWPARISVIACYSG